MGIKNKILLHTCCGVCSLYVIKKLRERFGEIILFWYNPNIHPEEEYERRLTVIRKASRLKKLRLIEGSYEPERWFEVTRGLEKEPEGGRRCEVCFRMRLEKSIQAAKEASCDCFTTTLTISPHKSAEIINNIGKSLAEKYGVNFLAEDFKKKDGFKKTMAAAKRHKFYRQNYCGCVFSQRQTK